MSEILRLDHDEARVLASIVEKSVTTPDHFPLTINAIKLACNQKSSRNPVVSYDEYQVMDLVSRLRRKHLVLQHSLAGTRVPKYGHDARRVLNITGSEMAILCVLMLRGPLTVGEIRSTTQRLHEFDDVADVHRIVDRLLTKEQGALISSVPASPGQKETRYAHLLCGEMESVAEEPVAPLSQLEELPDQESSSPQPIQQELDLAGRVVSLEERVEELERLLLELM